MLYTIRSYCGDGWKAVSFDGSCFVHHEQTTDVAHKEFWFSSTEIAYYIDAFKPLFVDLTLRVC